MTEKIIREKIQNCLIRNGFADYKKSFKQAFPRVKNHGNASPDIILRKKGKVFLIEIKLLPDKNRNANRFERSFIDCAYLKNEIVNNDVRGFFIIVDRKDTDYFEDKYFIETCESHLNINMQIHINWRKLNKNSNSLLLMAEVKIS